MLGVRTVTVCSLFFFFFNDTATTEIYTLSLHDALPISLNLFADFIRVNSFGYCPDNNLGRERKLFLHVIEIGRAHV